MKRPANSLTEIHTSVKARAPRVIWRSESGQSLVELALLTPLLMVIAIGIVEMGRYASLSIQVANAARAGAAYGAQNLATAANTSAIQAAVVADEPTIHTPVVSSVSCGCDNAGTISANSCSSVCTSGHLVPYVSVTASETFNSLFSYPGIPATITVSSTATMLVRQQ